MKYGLQLVPPGHPLHAIDEYLLARGWVNGGAGWLAPEGIIADVVAERFGRGHLRTSQAIFVQVEYELQREAGELIQGDS